MKTLHTDPVFLVTETCVNCGTLFALTEALAAQRKRDQKEFSCPNGHPQSYVESEADRLRKQLAERDRLLESRAELLDAQQREIATLTHRVDGLRGRLKQALRKRKGKA